ncbi:DUF1918 domain-containing protein [Haloparvum sp. PAK95]|uniref:DUF1918 domain-containing protein n=1 Tax=Haloparvum sp. PAK95 TaxID=3418962 RepID=UPI003D2EC81C
MSFEKEDKVVLHDKHSEYDGDVGTVTQVMETMFGEDTYIVSFEDGQEAGVDADSLEAAEEADVEVDEDDADEDAE